MTKKQKELMRQVRLALHGVRRDAFTRWGFAALVRDVPSRELRATVGRFYEVRL